MRGELVLLAAALVLATGCYSYTPTRVESLSPGQSVRVRLSIEETERLEEMRRSDSRLLEGTVIERSANQIMVDSPVTRLDPMTGTRALLQTLDIPVTGILEVELRERDDLKTAVFVGGLAVAAAIAISVAMGGDGSGGDLPPTPTPPESRIPVFSFFSFALPF